MSADITADTLLATFIEGLLCVFQYVYIVLVFPASPAAITLRFFLTPSPRLLRLILHPFLSP